MSLLKINASLTLEGNALVTFCGILEWYDDDTLTPCPLGEQINLIKMNLNCNGLIWQLFPTAQPTLKTKDDRRLVVGDRVNDSQYRFKGDNWLSNYTPIWSSQAFKSWTTPMTLIIHVILNISTDSDL